MSYILVLLVVKQKNKYINMESTNINYDFETSLSRIDEILNSSDSNYIEKKTVPSRSELTFTNGFYVNCTALFVDICDSSKLPEVQNRPVLAKIYRSFISEIIALLNDKYNGCKEISINGDCVWGVFDTPYKSNIDDIFGIACKIGSLVDILNYKLSKKGYATYQVGIGIDYGRALMIKAGYKGASINDVVWMGDVVNQACHLCSYGNESCSAKRIMLSNCIYDNLNEYNQGLCEKYYNDCYHSNAVNTQMNNWLKEQQQ